LAAKQAADKVKQYNAKVKAQMESNEKAHAAAVKKKQDSFNKQQDAMRAAHEAAEEDRKLREAAAIAKHK
jgi:hypothetical protein